MRDIYGNELSVNDYVIFKSDSFFTEIGQIVYIGKHSIQVLDNGFKNQIQCKSEYNILPVVKLGHFINNKTTGDVISYN